MWMHTKIEDKRIRSLEDKNITSNAQLLNFSISQFLILLLLTVYCLLVTTRVSAEELNLQVLIDEAVEHNHEILMAESKWKTSSFRIPQAKSLPHAPAPCATTSQESAGGNTNCAPRSSGCAH